jgi:hypothetical protein
MLRMRMLPIAAAAVVLASVVAQAAEPPAKPRVYGHFETEMLAGGTVNVLRLPFKENLLPTLSDDAARIEWDKPAEPFERFCDKTWLQDIKAWLQAVKEKKAPGSPRPSARITESFRKFDADKSETLIGFNIPLPPCWFPMQQSGTLTVKSDIVNEGNPTQRYAGEILFNQTVDVSVFWLPLLITLTVIGLIYPGCALMYGYMRRRNYEREKAQSHEPEGSQIEEPPSWLASLDPVQLTANPWGRASLGKLQIFVFTLLVFGLLLFYLPRSSVLAAMSADVMLLMGVSAVGAAGGKIAYVANRRLSFQNFAWLIRQGWLPALPSKRDVAPRAKWSELFLDSQTKEFDPYSFQMAIFSIIVAIALAQTSLSGLGTFKIPPELLGLLGISQAVFIAGKALDQGGYRDLDQKLEEVRRHESNVATLDKKTDRKPDELEKEKDALRESRAQAAQMFIECYRNQLQDNIPAVVEEVARGGTSAYDILNKTPDQGQQGAQQSGTPGKP